MCDLTCALVNQSVLYLVAIVPAAAVLFLCMKVFSAVGLSGVGLWFAFALVLIGESIAGIIPYYVSILTVIVGTGVVFNNRRQRQGG